MTVISPKIVRSLLQMKQWRLEKLLLRESIGFVPTMGALHDGHCLLIDQSMKDNDHTVVLIFVNPLQFAPHEDLDAYPRTLEADLDKLSKTFTKPVDCVFMPMVSEMYPSGIVLDVASQKGAFVTVQGCSEQLEGKIRPQFFRGVATVVLKLLNVVRPDNVYFGQKDAQQCVVVKNLVKDLLLDSNVKVLPTLREPNGLAMSSRNLYLSPEVRDQASIIYQGLQAGEAYYKKKSIEGSVKASDIAQEIQAVYKGAHKDFHWEYLSINHPETLDELEDVQAGVGAIVLTALRVPKADGGEARLIDNVMFL